MRKISVVVITRNEEKNIKDCLESVKWADEIIIVDDMSVDKTVEICRKYTQKIFLNDSEGSFHKNKNLGIEKTTGDWVFSLDADEVVSLELAKEIKAVINNTKKIGYCITRKNYFLGKWIRGCGWYSDCVIRLFKKGSTRWPLNIHDTPKIEEKNKVGYLRSPLIHYSYRNLNQYFEKFNRYTTRSSHEEHQKGLTISRSNFLFYLLIKPFFYFCRKYFILKGYRDGFRGFFISFSSALVIFVTYTKLWELQQQKNKNR